MNLVRHPVDILPAVIPCDFAQLERGAQAIGHFTDRLHLDIDDGLFTPHLSWPYEQAGVYDSGKIAMPAGISVEAHLMVREPRAMGLDLIRAGARSVIGHIEACTDITDAESMLTQWRAAGAREVGLAILLETPLWDVERCAAFCDVVQLMSVATIGAQGAPFDSRVYERIRALRRAHPRLIISVDGGVTISNAAALVAAGVSRLCIGSAIMRAPDQAAAYQAFCSVIR